MARVEGIAFGNLRKGRKYQYVSATGGILICKVMRLDAVEKNVTVQVENHRRSNVVWHYSGYASTENVVYGVLRYRS